VDGGIIDYHFDTPLDYANGIVLYLHFSPRLVPGWFDKMLPWRSPRPASLDNLLLVTPSHDFIATLPNGRIPDRHDFMRMDNTQRKTSWRKVLGGDGAISRHAGGVAGQAAMARGAKAGLIASGQRTHQWLGCAITGGCACAIFLVSIQSVSINTKADTTNTI
jgi:hypothetical protein